MPIENRSKKEHKTQISSNSFLFGLFINYLKPSTYVTTIKQINLEKLKEQGIKLIICDLDNTLVPHFTKFPTKIAIDFAQAVKDNDMEFILISNNTRKRVSLFAEKLKVDYIANAKKPLPFAMNRTIKKFNFKPQEVVVVGDMIITDILSANLLHMESILVQPLIDAERTWNVIIKWLEEYIFLRLTRQNILIKEEETGRDLYSEEYEIL